MFKASLPSLLFFYFLYHPLHYLVTVKYFWSVIASFIYPLLSSNYYQVQIMLYPIVYISVPSFSFTALLLYICSMFRLFCVHLSTLSPSLFLLFVFVAVPSCAIYFLLHLLHCTPKKNKKKQKQTNKQKKTKKTTKKTTKK